MGPADAEAFGKTWDEAELARPGGPVHIAAGRTIAQSHFEMVANLRSGLELGDRVRLGRTSFTVVGLTENQVASGGAPVAFITLLDAQKLQFELAPAAARVQLARGTEGTRRHAGGNILQP